jgi:plastocyanin
MQRRFLVLLAAGMLALGLAACSSSGGNKSSSASGATGDITIQNFTFASKPVKAGATVTVNNEQTGVEHSVTSDDGSSFSVNINGGSTATFTAPSKPGTYKFHCNFHSSMHGELVVTA